MDAESLKIFSETAFCCIKEERADRPYIDQVAKGLEKALKLQFMYENPELQRNAVDSTSSYHLRGRNLEHLKIGFKHIEMATEKFADKYLIGSGGYGMVYKAELKHFDSSNHLLKREGITRFESVWRWLPKNKRDLPKKRSTVAIKRINNREGEQGFIAEIEILTSCKHENLISLLGFCDEDRDHMILVYELASKGSLEDYMGNSDKMTNLTWMQRLKICLDIAHGLKYIHTNTDQDKQKIIHRDIKSANILLGENWEAKIADFGLSKFHPPDQDASTIDASTIAGTDMYLDPEYEKSGRLNKKSDIYSFGVVLFEILTGRLAYDPIYTKVNENGIAPIARHHFEKGTLREIVDHKIKEETDEHIFSLSKGPNEESLDTFSKIAFRCLAVTQVERPSVDVVINELKKALYCQENHKDSLKLSLQNIMLATKTFNQDNLIGHGAFGNVYKGHTPGHNIIAAKRLGKKSAEGEAEFMTELEILREYKHEHVIGLVGYCDEDDEKVIVYEYACRGSLDKYLSDDNLSWVMRLKICIDIAIGWSFFMETVSSPQRERRPTAHELVIQLKKALEFQEDYEKWEPKLPKDYKEIIQMSKCPDDYSTIKKEDLYNIFSKGILLQQDKVLLSFDGDRERNELVSATMFSYIGSCPHELKSLPESRFETVVEMLDISNLFIEIKTRAQFLSPNVVYGVYLVFKFCDTRNFSSKPVYVNLKYRKGHKSLHAYFATWRDEQWMMIELHRFLSQKEDVVFEFLLESFSSYYCGDAAVYVEGIEFRAIDKYRKGHESMHAYFATWRDEQWMMIELHRFSNQNKDAVFEFLLESFSSYYCGDAAVYVEGIEFRPIDKVKHEEIGKLKEVQQVAKAALYKFTNVKTFTSKPPAQSRFQEVIELLPQEVFHINCPIKSQMLSPDTEYVCYLLYKLSENCQGMHCPVKVRDILHQENKEAEFLYFITPEPSNIHDITRVPKQREDGWMEIQLWKFNSAHEFKDDSLSMNMKFTSHEGTMSGLIVCGLEFRPL
ncbi:kinase-like domain, phloem protein 2-like protein [Tanacetum coccineum]